MGAVYHAQIKTTEHGMETHTPENLKAKHTLSQCKIVVSVFGMMFFDWLHASEETTINAEAYCLTLRKLCRVIKKIGLMTKEIVLHDNARPLTAGQTCNLLYSFGLDFLDHLQYTPDLVPSDYHQFLHLKQYFSCKYYNGVDNIKKEVNSMLVEQAAIFIQRLL